jgi:hypothetical protein
MGDKCGWYTIKYVQCIIMQNKVMQRQSEDKTPREYTVIATEVHLYEYDALRRSSDLYLLSHDGDDLEASNEQKLTHKIHKRRMDR